MIAKCAYIKTAGTLEQLRKVRGPTKVTKLAPTLSIYLIWRRKLEAAKIITIFFSIIKCNKVMRSRKYERVFNCLHYFDSGASASTSARSSRSSNLGSGLSSRSATTSEGDIETETLDNVRVVAR